MKIEQWSLKRWQTLTGKQAVRESDGITFDDARQV